MFVGVHLPPDIDELLVVDRIGVQESFVPVAFLLRMTCSLVPIVLGVRQILRRRCDVEVPAPKDGFPIV